MRATQLPALRLASANACMRRRNMGIGGFTFRPMKKVSITGEAEGAADNSAYFSTSLHDYQKVRAQARFQAATAFSVSADFSLLGNQDPPPGVHSDYHVRQESFSFSGPLGRGKIFDLQGSYSRLLVRARIFDLTSDIWPRRLQSLLVSRQYAHGQHTPSLQFAGRWRAGGTNHGRGLLRSFHRGPGRPPTISRWRSSRCRWASTRYGSPSGVTTGSENRFTCTRASGLT